MFSSLDRLNRSPNLSLLLPPFTSTSTTYNFFHAPSNTTPEHNTHITHAPDIALHPLNSFQSQTPRVPSISLYPHLRPDWPSPHPSLLKPFCTSTSLSLSLCVSLLFILPSYFLHISLDLLDGLVMASARSGFRSRTASSSRNQPYMAVHEAIPEEDPPRYKDDKEDKDDDMEGLLASSDSDAGEDVNAVKMRRRRSSSGAGAGAGLGAKVKAKTAAAARRRSGSGSGGPGSYVPVVRNSGDYETYLDSITEAEQELLSADHGQEYEDYGERYDVDAEDYEQGYGVADSDLSDSDGAYPGKMKRRRMQETRGPCGMRVYWYSKAFCRSLAFLIVCLVLMVLGFVSLARYRKATPAYYVSYLFPLCPVYVD